MNERQIGISPREITLLRSVRDGEQPRKEIARILEASQPELTRLVKSLESKGFVVVRKQGVSTSLAFSDRKHAIMLRRILNEFAHMKLEDILSLSSLRIMASLALRPVSTRKYLQASSGVSPRTIQTVLSRLRLVGVLRAPKRGEYELGERFASFAEFARELTSFHNQKHALSFASDAVVVWERNDEFIVRTKATKEKENFTMTAFSAFESYGVPLIQDWHYYYHPHLTWQRTPDEVLLQSLLIKHLSSREMYAMKSLWRRKTLKRRVEQLRARAKGYGVEAELERLIRSFEGHKMRREQTAP